MTAQGLAQGEIEREAARILRKLMQASARLRPSAQGGAEYAVTAPGKEGALKERLRVPAGLIEAFRRRGWITPADGDPLAFTLSDAGLGWIRRRLAETDPFAAQHRIEAVRLVSDEKGGLETLRVNEGESPLGWLSRRKGANGRPLITETQLRAGERLRRDFTLARLNPRLAVDLTAPVIAGRRGAKREDALPEIVLAAKQRFAQALKAVGPGLADLLVDVCCHLVGLEAAERQNGWPQRSARIVLKIALDRLALHYGMAPVVGAGFRLRAWRADEEEGTPPANPAAPDGRSKEAGPPPG